MAGVFLNDLFKSEIKVRFERIRNVREFVSILNYIESQISTSTEEIFELTFSHLYYLSKSKDNRYTEFAILKKSGKLRQINSPDKLLKRVQSLINLLLQIVFESHSHYCSNGFLLGRDIKRNAIPHTNKKFVLNVDIEDFFPSINFRRVKVVLGLSPFNLIDEREKIAFIIANLGTYKNCLPQGSPMSPLLSNIVTQKLDRKISKFCLTHRIKYSRYADDLSFSTNKNILDESFIKSIRDIVEDENFRMNNEKTRLRSSRESQEVTGLVVNEKVNIKREYLQKVRAMLNNWEKGGLRFAEETFKKHQPPNKLNYDFRSVLLGHLSFLKLVRGDDDQTVKRLRLKFSFLNNLINYDFIDNEGVKNRLEKDNLKMEKIFFDEGIPNDKFISFCTSAFHQIENLMNYFYWKKFPNYDDLLSELLTNNDRFKKRYKTLDNARDNSKSIKNLDINVLIYLYEKEFFFDKKIYYNKHMTMLREIRNDESHRCSIFGTDFEKLKADYSLIETERAQKKKNNKNFILSDTQAKTELNYHTYNFLEEKNYKEVRKNLLVICNEIKNSLLIK
ncbi:reverse transcriptase domain-containing protein [Flavobacterium geliluteum]|uniref:RNA-directed DNA polymerase n=1 Tax=Flavobacterium geliluteum TaxID=2816120 RepID=A0A940XE53_9FLAO|nr:reverse transcriptase domain-containing protein [Flavobacterium geliluteum]MBP4138125.1 RNA-directed DNA polymerase [Flavobacterium geliluteum]